MAADTPPPKHAADPWGPPKRVVRRRRRRRLVLLVLAGIILLLAFAPTIIGHTPLINSALSRALQEGQGKISVGGASLGWFSNAALRDVEIRDGNGDLVLSAKSVSVDKSLLQLATNSKDLGTIRIEGPTLYIVTRESGSNIEDFLAPWLTSREPRPITVRVEVVDGNVESKDLPTGTTWRADELQATCGVTPTDRGTSAISLTVAAAIHPATGAAGRIQVSMSQPTGREQQLDLIADALPLEAFAAAVRRVVGENTLLAGRLSSRSKTVWTSLGQQAAGDKPSALIATLETSGQARVTGLDATSPALGHDRLQLAQLEMPWSLQFDGKRVRIDSFEARSEIGSVSAGGTVSMENLSGENGATGLTPVFVFFREPINARGEVDLARLAALLPKTLRIRDGTTITSGAARFEFHSATANGGHRWSGQLETTDLAARDGDRAWQWEQPVRVTFAVRDDRGWTIDALRCDSDFLQIAAAGNATQLSARATCDLDKLATRLGQFVDLSGWQLTGRGEATANVQSDDGRYQFVVDGKLDALRVAVGDKTVLDEPKLTAIIRGSGAMSEHVPQSCDAAEVQLVAGDDTLGAQLREPISLRPAPPISTDSSLASGRREPAVTPSWSFNLSARGQLARWLFRLKPWISAGTWKIDGDASLTAQVVIRPASIVLPEAAIAVSKLSATGPGWQIDEPKLELRLTGAKIAPTEQRFEVGESTLTSSAVAARARNLTATLPASGGPTASGEVAFRALLQRIDGWKAPDPGPPSYLRVAGEAEGRLSITRHDLQTAAELDAKIKDFTLSEFVSPEASQPAGYRTARQEAEVTIAGKLSHDAANDRLRIESASWTSDGLSGSLVGLVDQLGTLRTINLQGAVDYDLEKWGPVIAARLGQDVRMIGRERATFEIAGSLGKASSVTVASVTEISPRPVETAEQHWSRGLQGTFSAGWGGVSLFDLPPISAGRVSARLDNGAIDLDPLNIAIGEGRLTAAGRVQLDPDPQQLLAPRGQILERIRITPEVSDRMLKYIAPVLADAIDTEGAFSLSLEGGRVPLSDPKRADLGGQLLVHSVRVMPGPLAREFLLIAEQIEALRKSRDMPRVLSRQTQTWLAIDDRAIDFRMTDGRVHHRGLEFRVGDVLVRSEGSVGLDETLAIALEIPILREWLDKEPVLRGLAGQTIRVTVNGTFAKPEIDRRALRDVTGQILRSAAQGAIEDQLGRALDRLLRPKEEK